MSNVYMLTVTGGNLPSYRKLVTVHDPLKFVAIMRSLSMRDQMDHLAHSYVPGQETDDVHADILRTLKVKLFETGLKEYPETDAEVEAAYRRFDAGNKESIFGRTNLRLDV